MEEQLEPYFIGIHKSNDPIVNQAENHTFSFHIVNPGGVDKELIIHVC